MAHKTALDKLNDAVNKILTEYADDIQGNVREVAQQMGRKGAQALRQKAKETFPKGTGEYAQGWAYMTEQTRLSTSVTIYNKKPGLPHLLENGHVTRNGTQRVFPRTPAHVHIAPVAEQLEETFEREVLNKL